MSHAPSSIIFDLDGTLIDSRPAIVECFGRAVAAVFPGHVFDEACVRLGPPIRKMFQIAFPEANDSEVDGLLKVFRRHYDLEGPIKTIAYDGAEQVLADCQNRGIDLTIATNKPAHISKAILTHLKLDHYFRVLVAFDSTQPNYANKAEMVGHLLKSGSLKKEVTWYIGDSIEDAVASAECGLRFIWAAYGYGRLGEKEKESAFATIQTLADLTRLVG